MKYTIYTRGGCQACKEAKRYLNDNEVQFTEIYLMTDDDIKDIKSTLPAPIRTGQVALPLVFDENGYVGDKIDMIEDHQQKIKGIVGKSELYQILKNNLCSIVFTKVNGEERKMRCTLKEGHLPEGVTYKAGDKKNQNMNFMAVYDVENDGWRGFRIDSLKSIEVIGD